MGFSPDSLGLHEGFVRIASNAEAPGELFLVEASGVGVDAVATPEPVTLALVVAGLIGLGVNRRRLRLAG
jgi:hypothetical protein